MEQARADAREAEAAIEALRRADEAPEGEGAAGPRLGRLAGAMMMDGGTIALIEAAAIIVLVVMLIIKKRRKDRREQ